MRAILVAAVLMAGGSARAETPSLSLVAAENFYGDVAAQVAGDHVAVTSIIANPDQDPHLFEASPSVARALAGARIAVSNGADYDPWMGKLLAAQKAPDRKLIVAADLMHRHPGDNPHLWYDPATMPTVAKAIAAALIATDPSHAAEYDQRLQSFVAAMGKLSDRIADMRKRYAGLPVTATEPVFGLMANALGLTMRNQRFQLAVMNNTEPRASDTAAFENDLRGKQVRVLIYNRQATDTATQRLLEIAKQAQVPVVAVTETEPANTHYLDWMLTQLDALDKALGEPS
jgi:zinc/manganese transport system substrate-binding protein